MGRQKFDFGCLWQFWLFRRVDFWKSDIHINSLNTDFMYLSSKYCISDNEMCIMGLILEVST